MSQRTQIHAAGTLLLMALFSVASAYHDIQQFDKEMQDKSWQWIWKWPGIQRVRTFLWLATKNRLLTNAERVRRGIAETAVCEICHASVEDLDHILRFCPSAYNCWIKFIPLCKIQEFFAKPFKVWLLWNLNPRCMGPHRRLIFGTLCWKLWDNRNKGIFASYAMSPEDMIITVISFVNHTYNARGVLDSIADSA